jgi:cellulose synthase/poly-beta-1,6-N-acetylglucosamine synthase-like glycosyltransferase
MLGKTLIDRGIITHEQLLQALMLQQQSGGLLGDILIKTGMCQSRALYDALADHYQLELIDLEAEPPDPSLLEVERLPHYLSMRYLPWKKAADGNMLYVTSQPERDFRKLLCIDANEVSPRLALVTQRDLKNMIGRLFSAELTQHSIWHLWEKNPVYSAQHTLQRSQRIYLYAIIAALCLALACSPHITFMIILLLLNIFCLSTLCFKLLLFLSGAVALKEQRDKKIALTAAPAKEQSLPIYTILLPLYDEAQSLPKLIRNLCEIDYPAEKLDIKLILEADDHRTIEAAKALKPDARFEFILVPSSQPRTKPKACNYALQFARGEYVTIYDAEDQPDPQQLKRVVTAFREGGDKLVCIQCRLNYYNRDHNLLTSLFAIEYAAWFDFMLPGLDRLKLPIPLGGTSNHIHHKRLRELGEWDPFNVTEDADLGIRMAAAGYHTRTLDSETLEEAPIELWSWIKQRSRWVKGYMQTWLVHMRHPVELWRRLGAKSFFGFQLFIGGPCVVFLSTPILLISSAIWYWHYAHDFPFVAMLIPVISLFSLAFSLVLHLAFALAVVRKRGWKGSSAAIYIFPFYWILHSLASIRALWQLMTRPHYWDKTTHHGGTKNG